MKRLLLRVARSAVWRLSCAAEIVISAGLSAATCPLSSRRLARFLAWIIARFLGPGRSPTDRARALFELDNLLYALQNQHAIVYDGGLHPKHRLMRYHDFFTARISSSDRVLDVGCGIGAVAHDVATKTGATVTGIDNNAGHINSARSRYAAPNLFFEIGDATRDLHTGEFDVVILSNVLEHIADRPAFLRQMRKAIHPRRWLIRLPMLERDWRVALKRELGVEWRLDPTHETEYTAEQFNDEIKSAGLRVAHCEFRWGEIWAEAVDDHP